MAHAVAAQQVCHPQVVLPVTALPAGGVKLHAGQPCPALPYEVRDDVADQHTDQVSHRQGALGLEEGVLEQPEEALNVVVRGLGELASAAVECPPTHRQVAGVG